MTEKNIMMGLLLGRLDEKSWKLYQEASGREVEKEKAVVFSVFFDNCKNRDMLYQMFAEELKRNQKLLFIIYKDTMYCLILDTDCSTVPEKIRKFAVAHDISYRVGISSAMEEYRNFPSAVNEADIARQNVQENSCGYFEVSAYSLRTDYFSGMEAGMARHLMSGDADLAYQELEEYILKTFIIKLLVNLDYLFRSSYMSV